MTKSEIRAILTRMEIQMAKLGISKEQFYEASGISSASFSQWNTGVHKPTKKKIAQAATVLGVSLEFLLTGERPLIENEQKNNPPSEENGNLAEFLELFKRLSPEDQERELAYLQSRVAAQDK